jgi:hypothetical protein
MQTVFQSNHQPEYESLRKDHLPADPGCERRKSSFHSSLLAIYKGTIHREEWAVAKGREHRRTTGYLDAQCLEHCVSSLTILLKWIVHRRS